MTDGGDGLASRLHRAETGFHFRHHAQFVGVHGAAGKMNGIELCRADIPNHVIHLDFQRLIKVMTKPEDLASLERKEAHLSPQPP